MTMVLSWRIVDVAALTFLVSLIYATKGNVIIERPEAKSITVTEGTDVIFVCRHPLSESVLWSVSGMPIQNTTHDPQRFNIRREENDDDEVHAVSILTISKISRTEFGSYKCSNADTVEAMLYPEMESDAVDVKVNRADAVVKIKGPTDGLVFEGYDLWLTCKGQIPSALEWQFNKDVLADGDGVTLTTETNEDENYKKLVMTVHDVKAKDKGFYRCFDKISTVGSSIEIDVIKPGNVFIVRPQSKSITVSEDIDVILECRHPLSESVLWSVSGMPIQSSTHDPQRFSIRREENDDDEGHAVSILTISKISRTEFGLYKCSNADLEKATFYSETESDAVDVKVNRADAVVKIKGPTYGRVFEGKDLWLTCKGQVTSTLVWYFNGGLLADGVGVTLTTETNKDENYKKLVLTVNEVNAENEGLYRCIDKVSNVGTSIRIEVVNPDVDVRVGSSTGDGVRLQPTVISLLFIGLIVNIIKN